MSVVNHVKIIYRLSIVEIPGNAENYYLAGMAVYSDTAAIQISLVTK